MPSLNVRAKDESRFAVSAHAARRRNRIRETQFEIGRILHLLRLRAVALALRVKIENRNRKLDCAGRAVLPVQLEMSDFGFEIQDSSNFKLSILLLQVSTCQG